MGKSLFLGTLTGAVIVFVWMMVSWMFIPWHCETMNTFHDDAAVSSVMMENTTENGIYVLPGMCKDEDMEISAEKTKKGPVIFASIRRDGFDYNSPAPYVYAFIIQAIGAFLVTYLLLLTRAPGYCKGVWFVTVLGLAMGIVSALPNWVWWGFSPSFVGVEIADFVIAWFLASLAISAVAKRHAV